MFKNHPKGLIVLFFTEMWERFGFYTMLAIFVFYLQESFGWDEATATNIYGIFLAGVYFTPIIGGWLADNVLGYGKTITIGAITMAIGYSMMAIPTQEPYLLFAALAVVAIGNGLFKANISVLVGNLYNHSQASLKDSGFNIFYMGINIGAFYAPFAAVAIKNFFVEHFQKECDKEKRKPNQENVDKLKIEGRKAIKEYMEKIAPNNQPIASEQEFLIYSEKY